MRSRRFPHDLHFGLQFDSTLRARDILDLFYQLKDFGGGGSAFVNDKIPVNF
jgi:hypothetical protein